MSDTSRKPRRRTVLFPFVLAALAFAAWSVWWFVAAGRIEQGFEDRSKALKDRGYAVSWKTFDVSGYPFRFNIEVTDPLISEPGGWGLSAPWLEAEASALRPNIVVLVAERGVTLRRPDGRAFEITGEVLRASVGGFAKTPPRISVDGVKLAISPKNGQAILFPSIGRFEAHIRPGHGDSAEIVLSAEDATPVVGGLMATIAKGQPVALRARGIATQGSALHGPSWPALIQTWAQAGGALEIAEGGVKAGDALLTLKPSRITADPYGRAQGDLSMSLTRAKDGMLALGAVGVIPDETAAVASGLSAIGAPAGTALDATLTFRDGRTELGPLPIGPAPRLY